MSHGENMKYFLNLNFFFFFKLYLVIGFQVFVVFYSNNWRYVIINVIHLISHNNIFIME